VKNIFAVWHILSTVGDALSVPRGLGRLQIVGIAGNNNTWESSSRRKSSFWVDDMASQIWWLGCGACCVTVDKCATAQLNPFDVITCTVGVSCFFEWIKIIIFGPLV
jgi:hypothetical protein